MFRKVSEAKSDNFYAVSSGLQQMCPEELKRQRQLMEQKFSWPCKILCFTGLIYFDEQRPLWRAFRILRFIVLTALVIYQTGFILKLILVHGRYDITSSRGLIVFNFFLQSLISIAFLSYWQIRGYLQRLKEDIHCPKGCPMTVKVIRRTVIIYMSMLVGVIGMHLIVIWRKYAGDSAAENLFPSQIFEMYGTPKLFFVGIIVFIWAMYVWIAVLTFFVCVVTALQHELDAFNGHKLKKIGEDAEGDMEKIAEELQELYVTHVELANRVRNIDTTFEVYTFAMIGSNVPTSIVCLLSFMLSFQTSSWLGLALSIPDLAFCLFELVALTSTPAKIHARIREVESIIYGNLRIWQPFNDKVYRLASVFISHANQSNLGITLWGFAVVTKPLILTMISLTVTYLTVLMQVRDDNKPGAGKNVFGLISPTNGTV